MTSLLRSGGAARRSVVFAGLAALLLILPGIGLNASWQRDLILILIYALVVSGLNLSFGYAGELAVGQAALFAAGAYMTGYLSVQGHSDLLLGVVVAALVAGVAGLVSGIPGIRLGAWSLGMVSFFLVLLVPDFLKLLESQTGGLNGLIGIERPTLFGTELTPYGYYAAVIVIATICFVLLDNLMRSRHGDALKVLRQSPVLARSLGMSVARMKITAYVVGGLPAGVAGALFAYLDRFLAPQSFGFDLAIAFLAASILGGRMSVAGAIVGATILVLGPERATVLQDYSLVSYGLLLLLGTLVLLSTRTQRIWRSARVRVASLRRSDDETTLPSLAIAPVHPIVEVAKIDGEALSVTGLTRRFGGVAAVNGVSLAAAPGAVTAIIGPNGSGKTTLLNLISGFESADEGKVTLGGRTVTGTKAHRLARYGVRRTFQTPFVPESLTAAQVVATARYSRPYVGVVRAALRTPSYRRIAAADRAASLEALDVTGLGDHAEDEAASLPLSMRRTLEVARAVTGKVRLLLLDEPAAGLDEAEILELESIIRKLRDAGATIVLVEHNVPLVMRLADHVHVLASGEILVSGTPDEVLADRRVIESYLGMPA